MNAYAGRPKVIFDHMRISVTYYCNLHCEHCYVPVQFRDEYKRLLEPKQLSIEEITGFIDHLIDKHLLRKISVTGGEPLLKIVYERTSALLAHANRRGLDVQINTGGLGQVPIADIVAHFDTPSKLLFQFSLDGSKEATVDGFRNRQGVFKNALKQMSDAVAAGAQVQVRMTANRSNISEAADAYRLVSRIPVHSFKIKPMFAAGVAINNAHALIGDQGEIRQLQEDLIALSREVGTRLELPPPIFVDPSVFNNDNVRFVSCNCGISSGYLSTNGDLYPCSYVFGDPASAEYLIGNIRSEDFDLESAWMTSPALKNYKENAGCAQCPTQIMLLRNVETRPLSCV